MRQPLAIEYYIIHRRVLMIMDFLSSKFESCKTEEFSQFVIKAGSILSYIYGVDWENKLKAKELQAIFVCLSLLSNFELFKRLLFEEGYYKSSYLCAYVALPPRYVY
ncbi:hypothetical protein DVH24_034613 [Malus domestica]|uniref:Uncharacterized protein n=1 Tax=Malus domestica TaxID=3750 RepID=A0A498J1L5_MALDO|nr:hypothetical protein DVH24_034613 [Malus domestica]